MNYNLDDIACWYFDQGVKVFLFWYYWPNFVIGNFDEWQKLGITLNGMRPVNLCQSK